MLVSESRQDAIWQKPSMDAKKSVEGFFISSGLLSKNGNAYC